jgi:hypothetical protein
MTTGAVAGEVPEVVWLAEMVEGCEVVAVVGEGDEVGAAEVMVGVLEVGAATTA